ncbi:MAG: phosphoribosylanthranilate isomerase [Rikenellaceae bacterium]
MLIKVCGMRESQNIDQVVALGVDMLGFIFYDRSPRFVDTPPYPTATSRVGVFVNESLEKILEIAKSYSLTHIQLHGSESVEMCDAIRNEGLKVIKALSIAQSEDFDRAQSYHGHADMLLFDTKCSGYGGSGEQFDWTLLDRYHGETPFMLSGGIDENSAEQIRAISHPQLAGVDLNSRFEDAPALKNIERLKTFIDKIR